MRKCQLIDESILSSLTFVAHSFVEQHVYEDTQKDVKVLATCNQFNPAQYNPDIFQPVEQADEEVRAFTLSLRKNSTPCRAQTSL